MAQIDSIDDAKKNLQTILGLINLDKDVSYKDADRALDIFYDTQPFLKKHLLQFSVKADEWVTEGSASTKSTVSNSSGLKTGIKQEVVDAYEKNVLNDVSDLRFHVHRSRLMLDVISRDFESLRVALSSLTEGTIVYLHKNADDEKTSQMVDILADLNMQIMTFLHNLPINIADFENATRRVSGSPGFFSRAINFIKKQFG